MIVNINDIKIKKRVRTNLGNLESLKDSISRFGLLTPITINTKYELIAGNRRLEAVRQLGWQTIPAVIVDVKDKATLLELELEENVQRVDFTEKELMNGYTELEKLKNPSFFMRIWNKICAFFEKLFGKNKKNKIPIEQAKQNQIQIVPQVDEISENFE